MKIAQEQKDKKFEDKRLMGFKRTKTREKICYETCLILRVELIKKRKSKEK